MKFLAERPRLRSNLLAAFGLLLMLLLWLAPSGAFAAEVEWLDYGEIDYVAEEGEANDLAVDHSGDAYTFTESGNGVTLTDGDGAGGCEIIGNVATCPAADADFLWLDAGDEDDRISVDLEDTTMYTLSRGGDGDDTLTGGDGTDDMYGHAGDDTITGGDGDDYLDDGAGDDVVHAGGGADEFFGDVGDDVFNGEAGDDYFNGIDRTGADAFDGGPGNDWLNYRRTSPISVSLDDVADDGEGCPGVDCEGDNAGSDIENLSGGSAQDTLAGNEMANVITGEGGSDTLIGFGGDDELLGDWGWSANPFGAGDDTIDGGAGNDWLFGDYGADRLTGGAGVDGLNGNAGDDSLNSVDGGGRDADGCGSGSDSVTGDAGDVVAGDCETVFGAIVGGPAGPQGAPGPAGQPGARGPRGLTARVVRISRVTRTARHLRFTAVSTTRGVVSVKVRKAGRVVGSVRRSVRAGREFTLKIATRQKASGGRYTLTTTLRSGDERWTRSERVMVR
jgi:RTX calcium-binding nonapeptide repeat (4 copies)